jgi:hypothetical protein
MEKERERDREREINIHNKCIEYGYIFTAIYKYSS